MPDSAILTCMEVWYSLLAGQALSRGTGKKPSAVLLPQPSWYDLESVSDLALEIRLKLVGGLQAAVDSGVSATTVPHTHACICTLSTMEVLGGTFFIMSGHAHTEDESCQLSASSRSMESYASGQDCTPGCRGRRLKTK